MNTTWHRNDARASGKPNAGRTRAGGAVTAAAVALACGPLVTAAGPAAAQEPMADCAVSDFATVEDERQAAAGTTCIEFTMARTGEGDRSPWNRKGPRS